MNIQIVMMVLMKKIAMSHHTLVAHVISHYQVKIILLYAKGINYRVIMDENAIMNRLNVMDIMIVKMVPMKLAVKLNQFVVQLNLNVNQREHVLILNKNVMDSSNVMMDQMKSIVHENLILRYMNCPKDLKHLNRTHLIQICVLKKNFYVMMGKIAFQNYITVIIYKIVRIIRMSHIVMNKLGMALRNVIRHKNLNVIQINVFQYTQNVMVIVIVMMVPMNTVVKVKILS